MGVLAVRTADNRYPAPCCSAIGKNTARGAFSNGKSASTLESLRSWSPEAVVRLGRDSAQAYFAVELAPVLRTQRVWPRSLPCDPPWPVDKREIGEHTAASWLCSCDPGFPSALIDRHHSSSTDSRKCAAGRGNGDRLAPPERTYAEMPSDYSSFISASSHLLTP